MQYGTVAYVFFCILFHNKFFIKVFLFVNVTLLMVNVMFMTLSRKNDFLKKLSAILSSPFRMMWVDTILLTYLNIIIKQIYLNLKQMSPLLDTNWETELLKLCEKTHDF